MEGAATVARPTQGIERATGWAIEGLVAARQAGVRAGPAAVWAATAGAKDSGQ